MSGKNSKNYYFYNHPQKNNSKIMGLYNKSRAYLLHPNLGIKIKKEKERIF